METRTIVRINLFRERGGYVRVATLDNGNTHGLGMTGQPLLDFVGHRAEGYEMALPAQLETLDVFRILDDREPLRNGKYPKVRVGLDALEAPDLEGAAAK